MTAVAPRRVDAVREGVNAPRGMLHTGAPWRSLPGDVPPWEAVSQHPRRWLAAGGFAAMGHDRRARLRGG